MPCKKIYTEAISERYVQYMFLKYKNKWPEKEIPLFKNMETNRWIFETFLLLQGINAIFKEYEEAYKSLYLL